MKLYHEVKIESAEQAEALPEGTLATSEEFAPEVFVKVGPNEWFGTHGPGTMTDRTAVGWTALVPIEAEEETEHRMRYDRRGNEAARWKQTRLVTPWEPA